MSAHAPSANSAPYKLLGIYGQPVETTIDFVLPSRRTETIRYGDKWFSSLRTGFYSFTVLQKYRNTVLQSHRGGGGYLARINRAHP
jgi:hypothetical protein